MLVMSAPSNKILPAVGRLRPEMRLNSVVLPAPFGPMTLRISLLQMVKLTFCNALRPPKHQKRRITPQIKREFKRRAAIEPVIGHLKEHHRMGRNYLAHASGDAI